MAYNLNRTGDEVAELLNQVAEKTIYNEATRQVSGLMSPEDKAKLDALKNVEIGTTDFWNSCRGYIPEKGQIIIYSDYSTIVKNGETIDVPGIKIGSGNGYVQDLAFLGEDVAENLWLHINNRIIHITQGERDFWNNKLNVKDTQEVIEESLVFNRN